MKKGILLAIGVSVAVLTTGCQSTQSLAQDTGIEDEAAKAFIGNGLQLSLPKIPDYPHELQAMQTLIANHDGRTQALQAVLSAKSDQVNVVMMLANGPRIMEVDWTPEDILETRSSFAPEKLSGLNILADIFLVFWPEAAVKKALPENVFVIQKNGLRLIYDDERQIADIRYYTKDKRGRDHFVLTNYDLGYSLTIYSDEMSAQ